MSKEIVFHCSSCHHVLKCDILVIGRSVMCPLCRTQINVVGESIDKEGASKGCLKDERTTTHVAHLILKCANKKALCATILSDKGLTIGRDVGCGFQLNKPEVSRRHARITYGKNGWEIRDVNSRNGVFVNGVKQVESPLDDGDTIMICGEEMVFECADGEDDRKTTVLEIDASDGMEQQTMIFGSKG